LQQAIEKRLSGKKTFGPMAIELDKVFLHFAPTPQEKGGEPHEIRQAKHPQVRGSGFGDTRRQEQLIKR
jgi:hypothetical protein